MEGRLPTSCLAAHMARAWTKEAVGPAGLSSCLAMWEQSEGPLLKAGEVQPVRVSPRTPVQMVGRLLSPRLFLQASVSYL